MAWNLAWGLLYIYERDGPVERGAGGCVCGNRLDLVFELRRGCDQLDLVLILRWVCACVCGMWVCAYVCVCVCGCVCARACPRTCVWTCACVYGRVRVRRIS